jgi:AcrR family transcriptional regulator
MEKIKADKREVIMQATMELIAEHGFHGAPTSMIACRAGIAIGSIYRYFENKDVLIGETYQAIEGRVIKLVAEGYKRENPLQERFFHIAKCILKYMTENPMVFRFIEQFHNSPYGVAVRKERLFGESDASGCTNILKELYEDARASNTIKDLQLPVFFALALGSLINVTRDHILGFIELNDSLTDVIVGACWDAVKR